MVADGPGVAVAGHNGPLGDVHEVPEAGVAQVRDINKDAEAVQLFYGLDSELREAALGPAVCYAVCQLVPEAVDEAHHPDA